MVHKHNGKHGLSNRCSADTDARVVAVHHELMTALIKAIYLENGCRHLTDPVKRKPTFKAMTPIRLKVLRSSRTDVDAFQLIDALCTAVDQAFSKEDGQENGGRRQPKYATGKPPKADVIQLDNFRYRRFKHLA